MPKGRETEGAVRTGWLRLGRFFGSCGLKEHRGWVAADLRRPCSDLAHSKVVL
jgi:hypothetical protein